MFQVLLHPIADLRPLLQASAAYRLSRPSWPGPTPGKDFVRSSGAVRMRRQGGLDDWAGEDTFADASLALRLPNMLQSQIFGKGLFQLCLTHVFRRFYSAGVVSRFEIGFRVKRLSDEPLPSAIDTVRLLQTSMTVPARLRREKDMQPLVSLGDGLAELYLNASTNRKSGLAVEHWWVCAGEPTLLVEYGMNDGIKLPPHSRLVSSARVGAEVLHHVWLEIENHRCSVWLLRKDAVDSDPAELRKLRIHILRLHTERQCLRIVLQAVREGRIKLDESIDQASLMQDYLESAMPIVTRPVSFGVEQSQLLEVAKIAFGDATPGQAASFDAMRRQVAEKVARYIRRSETAAPVITQIFGDQMSTHIQMGNVTVSGDFNQVTAQNIENSFNKAAGSEVKQDLKEALKTLTAQVAELAKQLPPQQAEEVSKDLSTLTSEAVSKTPRKRWYEMSADGLLEAAKTVAEMSGPVTTAVKAVLALLA